MAAFGTVFMPQMALSRFDGSRWSEAEMVASDSISLHPGAHVLHYSSTCFEGLKAFKQPDGSIKLFRMDKNVERFAQSSELLSLPSIDKQATAKMITDIVALYADEVPAPPGSMYVRPTHFGIDPAIGKAAAPSETSLQYVLLSPVGEYFSSDGGGLRLLLDETGMRCAPHNGMIKSGGNYASALRPIMQARDKYKADQVLFCPGGFAQETGAANFLLIDDGEVITKALDESFLHGVTRDSILTLAKDMGMKVSERELSVEEILERAAKPSCEAALSGTAAVLAPVGTFIHNDKEYQVADGNEGPVTKQLRQAMNDLQWGLAEDKHGWLFDV
ncbi:branched-chain amino acid aminotransferase [uncultured Pseudoteredinibacter sp.]|uniref:branched-chain amino acid aminotransferase n=1 Tax=uncultured Pseudoteredinibacter sp. TaxID=1641701 RepID=UPI0026232AE2|nr:branched-chain amino acid aminotransferase [uncultured Pseudoteredinibacter sp.]